MERYLVYEGATSSEEDYDVVINELQSFPNAIEVVKKEFKHGKIEFEYIKVNEPLPEYVFFPKELTIRR